MAQQSFSGSQFGSLLQREETNPLSSIPRDSTATQPSESISGRATLANNQDSSEPEIHDPLAHMQELDKWGIKGFTTLMSNFPDYAALVTGTDISNLGFDLNSAEYVARSFRLCNLLNCHLAQSLVRYIPYLTMSLHDHQYQTLHYQNAIKSRTLLSLSPNLPTSTTKL